MGAIKRILVTGGAGFLGSHLCERLVDHGHDVICLDTSSPARRLTSGTCWDGPISSSSATTSHADLAGSREIYNLACPAAPGHDQFNPIKTMKTSVLGAINVLGMAKLPGQGPASSTSEVYGDPEVHPQPESYRGAVNPIGPGPATTKASGSPRRFSWTTIAPTASTCGSCRFSIPTGRGCTPSMAA